MAKLVNLCMSIRELLEKRHGIVKEEELVSYLKSIYGNFSLSDFKRALMILELRGVIYVEWFKRGSKIIRLRRAK
ncbi:MAG: hypothetical protein DRJ52_01575 [Thermoprotei archaeon]|nr:MAG: hypothetical protein DRJ52_01575 [Thermoprotei archaeon]HDI75411.1 hypothetical protein [Thermoprotei archaeon]